MARYTESVKNYASQNPLSLDKNKYHIPMLVMKNNNFILNHDLSAIAYNRTIPYNQYKEENASKRYLP